MNKQLQNTFVDFVAKRLIEDLSTELQVVTKLFKQNLDKGLEAGYRKAVLPVPLAAQLGARREPEPAREPEPDREPEPARQRREPEPVRQKKM